MRLLFEENLLFLCLLVSEVNYYSRDSNLLFVLVLISPHSWCVLPTGRPLIKPFSCRKLDYPSPLSPSLSLSFPLSPPLLSHQALNLFILHAQLQPWISFLHFPALLGWLNRLQIGAFYRNECNWLKQAVCQWLRKAGSENTIFFLSTPLTLKYPFSSHSINHWTVLLIHSFCHTCSRCADVARQHSQRDKDSSISDSLSACVSQASIYYRTCLVGSSLAQCTWGEGREDAVHHRVHTHLGMNLKPTICLDMHFQRYIKKPPCRHGESMQTPKPLIQIGIWLVTYWRCLKLKAYQLEKCCNGKTQG